MAAISIRFASLIALIFACLTIGVDGKRSNYNIEVAKPVQCRLASIGALCHVFRLRGGEAITIGKRKKQKPTFVYMVKAFFSSMVDPTYGGEIEVLTDKQKKAAKAKGKKNKLGTGPFGMAGPTGGSFGAVCGPGGCK